MPKHPVISIFTTYKINYEVAAGINKPVKPEMVKFRMTLEKLKNDFKHKGQNQRDEIKCYWIPNTIEDPIKEIIHHHVEENK